jgi:hypothetical protein
MLAGLCTSPLETTNGTGDRPEPDAVDGHRRAGREAQHALPPGPVDAKTAGTLPFPRYSKAYASGPQTPTARSRVSLSLAIATSG